MNRDTEKVIKVRALRFPSVLSWEEEEDRAKETERMSEAAETQERVVSNFSKTSQTGGSDSNADSLAPYPKFTLQISYCTSLLRREGMGRGGWARRVTPKPREWRGSRNSLYPADSCPFKSLLTLQLPMNSVRTPLLFQQPPFLFKTIRADFCGFQLGALTNMKCKSIIGLDFPW